MAEFKIGQKLWYINSNHVSRNRNNGIEVTIAKIGNKWVILDNKARFDKNDPKMNVDGGNYSSPGRCYLSKEDWCREYNLNTLWRTFRDWVSQYHQCPNEVTEDTLKRVMNLFQIQE